MTNAIAHSILHGVLVTVQVVLLAIIVATPLAIIAGCAKTSRIWAVRLITSCYIEFFRGTSALVQMFWAFYVLPAFGLTLDPFEVGFVVLGLNSGAYGAEIVRGALLAVPRGQWEAAQTLGIGRLEALRLVVFPQAVPVMLPPVGSQVIDILKASSLVSLITVSDFTRSVNQWATTGSLNITEAYTILLVGYLLLASPIYGGLRLLERRYRRRMPTAGR